MNKIVDKNFKEFFLEIKQKILSSQYEALKAVNKQLITLYWDIGKLIVSKQKQHDWGKAVVEQLSLTLQQEFPGIRGFSASTLWRMRNFYMAYHKQEKLAPLVREIGWTHNILILEKCKDDLEREFYIKMTKKFGWTKNVLIHHIDGKSYENFLTNQTNFDKTVPEKYRDQAKLAVKDEYTFHFLELADEHSEHELETALVNNIRRFLEEMGGYFTFLGHQYKVEVEDETFFIDLLLYHRKLRSLVAIELKIGDFQPEYAGKMQFYLNALNDKVRLEDENPSIGIIVCKTKKRTIVEYTLNDSNKPISVATYKTQQKLPKELKELLPSPEEITQRLAVFDDSEE